MIAGSSVFISINVLTMISSLALVTGFCVFLAGFRLLVHKRLVLTIAASKIGNARLGLIAAEGKAAGPNTVLAPITSKPCFLHHTTAWRQRRDSRRQWEKVAEETSHVPFFIDDSSGQLLIEAYGANLDLSRDFREEYDQPFLSVSAGGENLAPSVSAFLARHGVASGSRIRIEERTIKPDDAIFVAGTLTENPRIEVAAVARGSAMVKDDYGSGRYSGLLTASANFVKEPATPRVIRLAASASASGSVPMGQQAKIAAALTRAGIANPAGWTAVEAAGETLSLQEKAREENTTSTTIRAGFDSHQQEVPVHEDHAEREYPRADRPPENHFHSISVKPALTVVLMKDPSNPHFLISLRSREEFVSALAWKCAAMISGGAALAFFGIYMLWAQAMVR